MKWNFTFLLVICLCRQTLFSQVLDDKIEYKIKKSVRDWSYAIDTTWGAGLPTAQKLALFDAFWTKVDQTWGGFPNLVVNWDSLYDYYRPIVADSVSRGRFYGILFKLKMALNEGHVWVKDFGIDSTMGFNTINANEYPNYQSFHYLPGIPLLNLFSTIYRTNFGAGVTALADSTALVYSVMSNHPLNLQPGDIILGYDGIPWLQNLNELMEAELPALVGGKISASSPASLLHGEIKCAGMNWGLFDTIDVVKYGTNDTLHYPTSLLSSITQPYLVATEQLPVNGVPLPDLNDSKMVSWGVVEGTNIGYIYVLDWYMSQTPVLFRQAVDELMHINNVDGLILDFRTNNGGEINYANDGFKYLFNVDPTSNYSRAMRIPGDDHFLFTIEPAWTGDFFIPTSEIFDHPIAVLTGPHCFSAGDYNAFRLRFHPMSRFFGKATAGAYTAYSNDPISNNYYYRYEVDNGSLYSNYNNEEYLIHKGFPVDEEVWLTRDGVANGQDDVVNKALEWMNNLVYPHDILSDNIYYSTMEDTVHLSTIIENPNSHQLSARGYIHNLNDVLIDSVDFVQQTTNAAGENWIANLNLPQVEEFYKISVAAFDQTSSTSFTLPNAIRFTTAGPVVLDSISITKGADYYTVKPFVKNSSAITTITSASVRLICDDPWLTSIYPATRSLPNIEPGAVVGPTSGFTVRVDSTFTDYFNFQVEVLSNGWTYWRDSLQIIVGVEEEPFEIPTQFSLSQNFPNPFNPSSKIKYSVPRSSKVQIKVFDVLGKEIEILVNEEKSTGTHEITWKAANLPSGVYFYQLKAGSFVQTRKMLLLK